MIRISIIGMGMLGTSLGMALRSADDAEAPLGAISVTGYDADGRHTAEARGRLAIDREARSLPEAVREAQIVVVATPVRAVREVFAAIAPLLAPGTVVTDVASTKAEVMAWAQELLPTTVDVIGGHPMAGREKTGPAAATADLFRDAIYCLTPLARTRPTAIEAVEALVERVGAKVYFIDPAEHDAYVAGVSHLPFVLSAALVEVTSRSPGWREMGPLAATGFRDISRLASGDPQMHADILATNRAAALRWIDETAQLLAELRELVAAGDDARLLELFRHAREVREQWLEARPNMRPGEVDFENIAGAIYERPSLFGRIGLPNRDRNKR